MCIDEFPQLGKLNFFQDQLAFVRGYRNSSMDAGIVTPINPCRQQFFAKPLSHKGSGPSAIPNSP